MDGIYLLLGTNLGDKRSNLQMAIKLMSNAELEVERKSSIYQTAAWGKTNQEDFFNQVVKIKTELLPQQLLETLLAIELKMGRKRIEKWGSRLIDIDILYYGDEIIDTDSLQIPHPAIPDRRFTLIPLNELASDEIHPFLKKNQETLLRECKDNLEVIKVQ